MCVVIAFCAAIYNLNDFYLLGIFSRIKLYLVVFNSKKNPKCYLQFNKSEELNLKGQGGSESMHLFFQLS